MSFFQKIKENLYHRSIKKKLNQTKPVHLAMDYHSAKSIGILFDWKNKKEALAFGTQLKKDGKSIEYLTYVFEVKGETPPDVPYFTQKNINWLNIPKGPVLEQFIHKPKDIIFNLAVTSKKYNDFIIATSNACFKIGPPNDQEKYYHLMYDSQGDLDIFIHNIYDLLKKTIKKND
jgi:hypothetical protein